MPKKQRQKKQNLLEELTTHKCDYQAWPFGPAESRSGDQERTEPTLPSPPPWHAVDIESHIPYSQSTYVPFDLFGYPKAIIGQNPWECFQKKTKASVNGPEKKNPSPLLSPAVPLDDIENDELRRMMLKYTYTSLQSEFQKEAAKPVPPQPNPANTVIMDANFKFESEIYPPLPPGWICAAKHWDSLQSRTLGDPCRTFWTRRGADIECGCCCNPVPQMLPQETKDQIRQLILDHKLRLPYDETKVGYRGYRPICAKGVPLEQKEGFGYPKKAPNYL